MQFQQIRGATAIVSFGGKTFLIDPFLADKGSAPPVPSPYNNLPNPLVDLPLPVERIVDVDAVIVTHMHHFDHFDAAARDALPKDMPVFVQNIGEAEDMRALGFTDVTALSESGTAFHEVVLFRTAALHGRGEAAARNYRAFGTPGEASGVAFTHPAEKTLYLAGDTVWFSGVREAIDRHRPAVIVINAAQAAFADETPILMGTDDLREVIRAAPQAVLIASHMDAVNHARLTRADLTVFIAENGLAGKILVPADGETLTL